jgi:methionine aminopeptidase
MFPGNCEVIEENRIALYKGIEQAGSVIKLEQFPLLFRIMRKSRIRVVREYVGHGIGR